MEMLLYAGKVNMYWIILYACYRLLLRNHTFFHWNRFYLLGSLIAAFALPLIVYPDNAPSIPAVYEINAAAFEVSSVQAREHSFSWMQLILVIYSIGFVASAITLFQRINSLNAYLKAGEIIDLGDCTIVLTNSDRSGSFSYMKRIVITRNDYENHFDSILTHEMVHTREWHSLDILFLEFLKVICWFNPVLILYKRSLQEVHEFLADFQANDRENYAGFLISYALNAPTAALTNPFFKSSLIKNRVKMIYKSRTSKWMLCTYVLAVTVIATTAMFVAGCEKEDTEMQVSSEKKSVSDDKIFTVAEEQPEFPGGNKAMFEFLGENIKYPEAASKANVEGRVFLTFVVTQSGEVRDVQVLKGVGYGCDSEAIRVLSLFPKWKPAKQNGIPVNVKYNLPINFQLKKKEDVKKAPDQSNLSRPEELTNKTSLAARVETENKRTEPFAENDKPKVPVSGNDPLYIVNSVIIEDHEIFKNIDPEMIKSVSVIRNKDLLNAYGEKGKNGVVSIITNK